MDLNGFKRYVLHRGLYINQAFQLASKPHHPTFLELFKGVNIVPFSSDSYDHNRLRQDWPLHGFRHNNEAKQKNYHDNLQRFHIKPFKNVIEPAIYPATFNF